MTLAYKMRFVTFTNTRPIPVVRNYCFMYTDVKFSTRLRDISNCGAQVTAKWMMDDIHLFAITFPFVRVIKDNVHLH